MIELIFRKKIGINKTSGSKECDICHYWYFKDGSYKLQPYICDCFHVTSMMAYELNIIKCKKC